MSFINEARLKNYPRLIAAVFGVVLILNTLFRRGWEGWIGGLIGFDFLTFYAVGRIYCFDTSSLYDIPTLFQVEQEIYQPTSLGGGGNIFSYPPYVASISGLLTIIPFKEAFFLWVLLSILFVLSAAYLLSKNLIPIDLEKAGLNYTQLLVILFSFFPLVFGIQLGQNHALTLLLVSGILVFTIKERWVLAGACAGLLLYKPHFVLGFLFLWFVWRKFKALAAVGLIAAVWFLTVYLTHGFGPYWDYLQSLPILADLPFGVGRYLEVSLYGLIGTILPKSLIPLLFPLNLVLLVGCSAVLVWIAYRLRHQPMDKWIPALILALLYPFFVSPHVLIHDMVILVPLFLLWSFVSRSKLVLYAAIFTYVGSLLILFLSYPTQVALLAFIPVCIVVLLVKDGVFREVTDPLPIISSIETN